MKTLHSKSSDNKKKTTLWDEFINYLEQIYFEGAADILDTKLISFEYHEYCENFA